MQKNLSDFSLENDKTCLKSSVVDPEWFFSDPAHNFQVVSDPDPT